jgi:pimeloyl-ACP methyl ester carboxylesterase
MSGASRVVRGIKMTFDERGRGAPVVLLHGFPFNHTLWSAQAEALGVAHRVVTPDLRGHGGTGLGGEVSTMEEMAEDVAALLDALGVTVPVVLGGLSMGGYVTLAFYRLFPERVRALILADTRPQGDTDEARRTREETALTALREGMRPIADSMLPKLLAPATHESQPEVVKRVREMILSTSPAGAAAALRGMAARRDQTDLLAEIDVPTLILVGSEDAIIPPPDSETMRRAVRGSRLVRLEGAGHVSNLERPREFNHALAEFVSALAS